MVERFLSVLLQKKLSQFLASFSDLLAFLLVDHGICGAELHSYRLSVAKIAFDDLAFKGIDGSIGAGHDTHPAADALVQIDADNPPRPRQLCRFR